MCGCRAWNVEGKLTQDTTAPILMEFVGVSKVLFGRFIISIQDGDLRILVVGKGMLKEDVDVVAWMG